MVKCKEMKRTFCWGELCNDLCLPTEEGLPTETTTLKEIVLCRLTIQAYLVGCLHVKILQLKFNWATAGADCMYVHFIFQKLLKY